LEIATLAHLLFSQFVFQDLNINPFARTTGRQLAIDRDCRNGSNAQLLGAPEDPSVHHTLHGDLGRRTGLSSHYVNYLMAESASRAEHFDFPFRSHPTHSCSGTLARELTASAFMSTQARDARGSEKGAQQ
jgi:hypothetical protein